MQVLSASLTSRAWSFACSVREVGMVQERVADWRCKFEGSLGLKVLEVTGDTEVSETADLDAADIICTTPEKFGELCAC